LIIFFIEKLSSTSYKYFFKVWSPTNGQYLKLRNFEALPANHLKKLKRKNYAVSKKRKALPGNVLFDLSFVFRRP